MFNIKFPTTSDKNQNKILDKYYFIRKNFLSTQEYEKCKEDLYAISTTKNYMTGKPSAKFKVYRENEEWIGMPIMYALDKFGTPDVLQEDISRPIDLKFVIGGYRTDYPQQEVIEKTTENLLENGAVQICLDTGLGKTICTLDIISRLKKKTMVVVHKDDSIEQWIKKISVHLPGAKCGELRGRKYASVDDMDIVFSTVQSLSQIQYPSEVLDQFGLLVADEIHLMAAKTFHRAFINVNCKYRLGLSATPIRKDGLSKVISWFFGSVTFNIKQPRSDINVLVLHYREGFEEGRSKIRWLGRGPNRKQNRTTMISDLVEDEERNNKIISQAVKMASKESQTLLLSERVVHCQMLSDCVDFSQNRAFYLYLKLLESRGIHKNILPECLYSLMEKVGFISTGTLVGSCKRDEREKIKEADVICATMKMAKDSLDLVNLSNMIIATPISKNDIQQVRGRLLRKPGGKDTKTPLLCIIYDEWEGVESMFGRMFWGVLSFLKANNYPIIHR